MKRTDEFYKACLDCDLVRIQQYIDSGSKLNFVKNGKSPFEILIQSNNKKAPEALSLLLSKHLVLPDSFEILREIGKKEYKLEKFEALRKNLPQLFERSDFHQHLSKVLTLYEYELDRTSTFDISEAYVRAFLEPMTYEDKLHFICHLIDKSLNTYARMRAQKKLKEKTDILIDAIASQVDMLVSLLKENKTTITSQYSNEFLMLYEKLIWMPDKLSDKKSVLESYLFCVCPITFTSGFVSKFKNNIELEPDRMKEFLQNSHLAKSFFFDFLKYTLENPTLYEIMKKFLLLNTVKFDDQIYSLKTFFDDLHTSKLSDFDRVAAIHCAAVGMLNNCNFELLDYKDTPHQRKNLLNI